MSAGSNDGSVAPKERVNIVYRSATGDQQEDVELPLKMLVLGDYTLEDDDRVVEEREPINVDKDNFNDVLQSQNLSLQFTVPNKLPGAAEDSELPVKLDINSLHDFEPGQLAQAVPELQKLVELRNALKTLKSPLSNVPAFRKKIQQLIQNEDTRQALLEELGIDNNDA